MGERGWEVNLLRNFVALTSERSKLYRERGWEVNLLRTFVAFTSEWSKLYQRVCVIFDIGAS